jgi:hypothetical protein
MLAKIQKNGRSGDNIADAKCSCNHVELALL